MSKKNSTTSGGRKATRRNLTKEQASGAKKSGLGDALENCLGFMRVKQGELRPEHVVELLESMASAADESSEARSASDCETLLKCAAAVDAVLAGNCTGDNLIKLTESKPLETTWKFSSKPSKLDAITSQEMKIAIQKARSSVEAAKVARRVEELVKSWDEFVFASKVAFAMQRKASGCKAKELNSNARKQKRKSSRKSRQSS